MAGSLIKVDEFTISSALASIILGGGSSGSSGLNASIDTTYNVYVVQTLGVKSSNDNVELRIRVGTSGTLDSDSEYDYASKNLRADTTYGNFGEVNQTNWFAMQVGTGTQEQFNSTHYLFNFANSSEYSFITNEITGLNTAGTLTGQQGGGVHTVNEANDSIGFVTSAGTITAGTFTLYGLKK